MTWIAVACTEAATRALADNLVRVLAPGIAVGAEGVDGDKPLDKEIGELDKEAVFGGVEDEGGELFADAVLHEADFLPLDQFALGFGGAALGVAGFFGDLGELGFGDGGWNSRVWLFPRSQNRDLGHPGFGLRLRLGATRAS